MVSRLYYIHKIFFIRLFQVFNYTHSVINVFQFYKCYIHGIFVQAAVFQIIMPVRPISQLFPCGARVKASVLSFT